MKEIYVESIQLLERLHRQFLDVVKTELERLKIVDINNIQTLILHNIGNEELTIGELTNRGYYLGSNVSYNVKKMVENAYLVQVPAPHDKRSTRVRLSDKGLKVCGLIDELYQRNIESLQSGGFEKEKLAEANETLKRLERFWSEYITHAHRLG